MNLLTIILPMMAVSHAYITILFIEAEKYAWARFSATIFTLMILAWPIAVAAAMTK